MDWPGLNIEERNINNKGIFLATTIAYMVVLLYLSIKPVESAGEGLTIRKVFHNLLHVPAYGLLTYLLWSCFRAEEKRAYIVAFVASVLYGAFNEFLQSFSSTRTASFGDMLLNAAGAYCAVFLIQSGIRKSKGPLESDVSQL